MQEYIQQNSSDINFDYDQNFTANIATEIKDIMDENTFDDDQEEECERRFENKLNNRDDVLISRFHSNNGNEWNVPSTREDLIKEMKEHDSFPIIGLESIKRQASKPYQEKIAKLQSQISHQNDSGKDTLSNDELSWLIKLIEDDEEFGVSPASKKHANEISDSQILKPKITKNTASYRVRDESLEIIENCDDSYIQNRKLEEEIMKVQDELDELLD